MNQITIDKNILLVEVPVNASDPWVINNGRESVGLNWYEPNKSFGEEGLTYSTGVKLPVGNWQFIGTTDDVSEEIAEKIVKKEKILNAEYYFDYVTGRPFYYYAVMSYKSWLRANKIPNDKRFAILKLNP